MRFQCSKQKVKKHIKPHKYFAWFPTAIHGSNDCVWCEWIEREQWYEPDDDGMWGWWSRYYNMGTNLVDNK